MSTIRAIPVVYGGTLFRSTLEARWALVFDRCGFVWRYEPEAFALVEDRGRHYLPDFSIEDKGYVEIKPMEPSAREVKRCASLAKTTDDIVWLLYGEVGHARALLFYPSGLLERFGPPGITMCCGVEDGCPSFTFGDGHFCHAPSDDVETVHEILRVAASARFEPAPAAPEGWSIGWLLDCDLTEWESDFVESIQERMRKRWSLTDKQEDILERIINKHQP